MAIYDEAKLVNIASGYKAATYYSVLPDDGSGDFDVARNSVATRVNSDIKLEEMAVHVPRISYDSGVTCPYCLLEPQRTNLLTYPVSFDNAYWTKSGSSVTSGQSAPHATLTTSAFKLVENSATSTHYIQRSLTVTNGVAVTCSIVAKADERTWIRFEETAAADGYYFDLTNGVIGTAIGTVDAYSITPLADSNYLISITVTVPATTAVFKAGLADADNSNSYSGDGSSGAYIAFAQLEEGAYPTSWIYDGTEGSTTTRIADEINNAGVAATFNSVEGVLYAEMAALATDVDGAERTITLSDGTTTNRVQVYYSPSENVIHSYIRNAAGTQAAITYSVSDVTDFHKVAIRYRVNDFSLWIDGVERGTDVSGTTFAADVLTECSFDNGGGTDDFSGKCREVSVFEYLTDAQMAELTT